MLEKEFDRLVKDSLTDHVSEVPGDMWTRVHAQEKRRRALLFWRFTGGGLILLALLLSGATYFFHRSVPTTSPLAATPAKNLTATDANPSSAATSSPASPSAAISSPASPPVPTSSPATSSAAPSSPVRPARTTSVAASTPPATSAAASSTGTRENHTVATNNAVDPVPASRKSSIKHFDPAATLVPASTEHTTASIERTTASTDLTTASIEHTTASTEHTTASTEHTTASTEHTAASTERTIKPTQLARIPASYAGITARAPHSNSAISTASIPKPKPQTQQPPHNWQLDLYGSPDYLFSEFHRGLSYTGGVRLTKVFHPGWNVSAGLQYSRFNLVTQLDSMKYTGIRNLNTLGLPVLAGYSWGSERFRFGVNAGLIVNLYSWTEQTPQYAVSAPSQYYSSNPALSTSFPPQPLRYQFNVSTSWYLGFSLSGYLGHGFSFFAEPYLRQSIFGPQAKIYPAIQGITATGVTIGLRRQF